MRFTKPDWVRHQDGTKAESAKPLSIFSVHVHPDGSRIATGGLDAKIRIWSTKPILNQASELSGRPPKSLCTLTMHTGPVLTVRWAHSGRWLASGSDDTIVMIWDLDPHGAGRVWGTDEYNVEGWKALKRLPDHESDITDVAWHPDDRYLASVALDSKVLIWCGFTLERLRKLDLHQGFVKGVCWDPVGEFLATQSDDRTVRIWRTTDWEMEATVDKPFEQSPGSTFFRRLSWSPDGAHITASNAMNNNGMVFVAAVITRNTWTSEISLVGHENTVEVAAYNPHIFLRDPAMPIATANICSVVALGADDRSISVWQTKSARPLIVAKEVFERQILDLSWSKDGYTLYAVSSDGTMGVFNFDKEELEGIAPIEAQSTYLQKYGFIAPPLPPGYLHPKADHENGVVNGNGNGATYLRQCATTPPPTPPGSFPQLHDGSGSAGGSAMQSGFGAPSSASGEQVTKLVARKGKKRVQSTFAGSLGAGAAKVPSAATPSLDSRSNLPTSNSLNTLGLNIGSQIKLPAPPPMQPFTRNAEESKFSSNAAPGFETDVGFMDDAMDMDVPISALDTRQQGRQNSYDDSQSKLPKARTLGGDRVMDAQDRIVREIRRGGPSGNAPFVNVTGDEAASRVVLDVPPLKTFMEVQVGETDDTFEAKNPEDGKEPTEIAMLSAKEKSVQWLDYLPSPAIRLVATTKFCAVATEDGAINVYSQTGRRSMPTIFLGWPCAFLEGNKHYLLAISCTGQVYVWNTKTQRAEHPPVSLLPILLPPQSGSNEPNAPKSLSVLSASIRQNGAPLVRLSSGATVAYDSALCSWIRVGDAWWAEGSSCWKARRNGGAGIVSDIEAQVEEHRSSDPALEKIRPKWWGTALTLGHLETRMHAARVLESAAEYRQALLLYAKTIADEGFRAKGEELLKELFGPVYWRPGKSEDNWNPQVIGMYKRDLVKDVVQVFGRSKTLYKLAQDYQDLLKRSSIDD